MNENTFYKVIRPLLWVITIALAAGIVLRALPSSCDRKVDVNSVDSDWSKLMLVLESVDENYVDDIDHKKVMEDIIPDVMRELDPHSVYLPPQELKEAEESLAGGFEGIGIQFNVPNDTIVVNSVITGGPSEKAGLRVGDRVIKVDERVVAGVAMPQDTMVSLMRGPKGTKVIISILRHGSDDLIPFTITRDKIPVNSVDVSYMLNDTTGYIKLSKFARTTYSEFAKALDKLRGQGMKRLVFDLRDNSGGYLDQAMLLANEFLEKGQMIVYMEGKARPRTDLKADGRGRNRDLDIAVLINSGSASASEIFAGAIQDNDRGTIYGVRSFGKGLVQEPVYFSDGSGIRLTVARYYTPSGRCIQKPYSEDYELEIYERYASGEMFSADSIKLENETKYKTAGGRTVYGGGGIVPDVFVPVDTVGVTDFYVECNRLGLQIKYASEVLDAHTAEVSAARDMRTFDRFIDGIALENGFLQFAKRNNVSPKEGEWERSKEYILTQVRALIARYTPMGDDAFYPIYQQTDKLIQIAVENEVDDAGID
ncbi:MAG: PDZ domain-containing protein [Bacteroidales bacterium]|nr:PDZ domain-containing protein [Bacteroidales bacterium]